MSIIRIYGNPDLKIFIIFSKTIFKFYSFKGSKDISIIYFLLNTITITYYYLSILVL